MRGTYAKEAESSTRGQTKVIGTNTKKATSPTQNRLVPFLLLARSGRHLFSQTNVRHDERASTFRLGSSRHRGCETCRPDASRSWEWLVRACSIREVLRETAR